MTRPRRPRIDAEPVATYHDESAARNQSRKPLAMPDALHQYAVRSQSSAYLNAVNITRIDSIMQAAPLRMEREGLRALIVCMQSAHGIALDEICKTKPMSIWLKFTNYRSPDGAGRLRTRTAKQSQHTKWDATNEPKPPGRPHERTKSGRKKRRTNPLCGAKLVERIHQAGAKATNESTATVHTGRTNPRSFARRGERTQAPNPARRTNPKSVGRDERTQAGSRAPNEPPTAPHPRRDLHGRMTRCFAADRLGSTLGSRSDSPEIGRISA
jgi:hypothetical protein